MRNYNWAGGPGFLEDKLEGRAYFTASWLDKKNRRNSNMHEGTPEILFASWDQKDVFDRDEEKCQGSKSFILYDQIGNIHVMYVEGSRFDREIAQQTADVIEMGDDYTGFDKCRVDILLAIPKYFSDFLKQEVTYHQLDPGAMLFSQGLPCIYLPGEKELVILHESEHPLGLSQKIGDYVLASMDTFEGDAARDIAGKFCFSLDNGFLPMITGAALLGERGRMEHDFGIAFAKDLQTAFDYLKENEAMPQKYFIESA